MLHSAIHKLANFMALLGGIVLCLLVLMVCVSISGRELSDLAHSGLLRGVGDWLINLGVGPILGDFELVEAGVAFAIFAFLPLTQLSGAHAKVDVFTQGLGPRVNACTQHVLDRGDGRNHRADHMAAFRGDAGQNPL